LTNSLSSPAYALLSTQAGEAVKILNPLSNELSVMRQSMLFTGLEAISYNSNRKKQHLKFFEFGKTYHQIGTEREENKHLALLITGNKNGDSWAVASRPSDFFTLKTTVENILLRLGITDTNSTAYKGDLLSEGLSLYFGEHKLVSLGVVKKSILKKFDLKQEVLYADFAWDQILRSLSKKSTVFKEIPKYPEVKRDFALLLDNDIPFTEIHDIAFETETKFLRNITLFDVYTGKNLAEGKKSYAVSFTLQNDKGTLTEKQIDKIMSKLQENYEKRLGAVLR
jgi:phenylalanyl-tRNA synthetase beta chain